MFKLTKKPLKKFNVNQLSKFNTQRKREKEEDFENSVARRAEMALEEDFVPEPLQQKPKPEPVKPTPEVNISNDLLDKMIAEPLPPAGLNLLLKIVKYGIYRQSDKTAFLTAKALSNLEVQFDLSKAQLSKYLKILEEKSFIKKIILEDGIAIELKL